MAKTTRIALTAFLIIAVVPATASAAGASTAATYMGKKVLEKLLGAGIEAALNEALGLYDVGAVDLSTQSLQEVATIIEEAIDSALLDDYEAQASAALANAGYYKQLGSDLSSSYATAWDVMTDLTDAIEYMDSAGLSGAASYGMLAAMRLGFLNELSVITAAMGETEDSEGFAQDVVDTAADDVEHLKNMEAEWDTVKWDIFDIYWKKVSSSYDFWKAKTTKKYRVCYTDLDGTEICSSTRVKCTKKNGEPFFTCNDSDPETEEVEALREVSMAEARDEVLGEGFDDLVDELNTMAGQ